MKSSFILTPRATLNQWVIFDAAIPIWYYYVQTLFDVNVSSEIKLPYLKVNGDI